MPTWSEDVHMVQTMRADERLRISCISRACAEYLVNVDSGGAHFVRCVSGKV